MPRGAPRYPFAQNLLEHGTKLAGRSRQEQTDHVTALDPETRRSTARIGEDGGTLRH